jgi:hypothetical protein
LLKSRAVLPLARILQQDRAQTPVVDRPYKNNKEQPRMAPRLAPAAVGMIVFAFAAGTASATVTEYTDPTAYNAASSNSTTFTFDSVTPPGTVQFGDVTLGHLTFAGDGPDYPFVFGSGTTPFYGGTAFFTSLSSAPGIDAAEVLCTSLGSTAIGFIYGDLADGGGQPFTVTLSTGDSFELNTPASPGFGTGFVGFVSNTPITSVTFSDNGQGFDLLQVDESSARSVPEPATLELLAAGLLSLAVLGRRRALRVCANRQ